MIRQSRYPSSHTTTGQDTSHGAPDPADTVKRIDIALKLARGEGLKEIEVRLAWYEYSHLLQLKGLPWYMSASNYYGPYNERRPLKIYRGHVLKLLASGLSHIAGKTLDGDEVAFPVPV